jgi:hypothetical protein
VAQQEFDIEHLYLNFHEPCGFAPASLHERGTRHGCAPYFLLLAILPNIPAGSRITLCSTLAGLSHLEVSSAFHSDCDHEL